MNSSISGYYLKTNRSNQEQLDQLWSWDQLKIGMDGEDLWITNFTSAQIESVEVKRLASKQLFYAKHGKLFPMNSVLPVQNEPTFLWTPIQRALPIQIPEKWFNHNFFGLEEKVEINVIPDIEPRDANAMLIKVVELDSLLSSIAEVRLSSLQWTIIDDNAFIIGTPILPLNGEVFWQSHQCFLPVGYRFELDFISEKISVICNQDSDFTLWLEPEKCISFGKDDLVPLSRDSVKNSLLQLSSNHSFNS